MPKEQCLDFSSVTLSFFVHATEDEERLKATVLGSFKISDQDTTRKDLAGHYGNRLAYVKAHIIGERASEISRMILSRLDQSCKPSLISELEKYLDEHDALYLRLDRQEMPGRFILGEDEPIRIKLKPKVRMRDRKSMIEAYAEMIQA